jgi:antirestriction protein ArdC
LLHAAGYESSYWLTYRQAQDLGGPIRKGEKGWPVVFWKWLEAKGVEETDQEGETNRKAPILRYYTVFNLAQCEAIPAEKFPASEQPHEEPFSPIEQAEAIVRGYQRAPRIEHGHAGAWYRPSTHLVGMPSPERFTSTAEYYGIGHEGVLQRSERA